MTQVTLTTERNRGNKRSFQHPNFQILVRLIKPVAVTLVILGFWVCGLFALVNPNDVQE